MQHLEIPPSELRWIPDQALIDFERTDQVKPREGTIGQERALQALRVGIEVEAPGFNIFVCGITGTGRTTTVASILRQISPRCRPAPDRAYVHNFDDPDRPTLLSFPSGEASTFAAEMRALTRHLREAVPRMLESAPFEQGRKQILEEFTTRERQRLQEMEKDLTATGFTMAEVSAGGITRPQIVLRRGDSAFPITALEKLVADGEISREEADRLRELYERHTEKLGTLLKQSRAQARQTEERILGLVKHLGAGLVDGHLEDLKERFPEGSIVRYLDQVGAFVLENLELFQERGEQAQNPLAALMGGESPLASEEGPLQLRVNVIRDGSSQPEGCPIIMETRPTFRNLFGVIERTPDRFNAWRTDFTRIHAGSLLRADGGALVLNAREVLEEPWVWPALKRVLRLRQLEIHNPESTLSLANEAINPEPIPLDVKVVLIGDYWLYQFLSHADPDFDKIFKVLAHFDSEMDATPENVHALAGCVARICRDEQLLPLDRTGFGAFLEHSVRLTGRRGKLSSRLGELTDVLRESTYHAREAGRETIDETTIDSVLAATRHRHSLQEEKIRELVQNDTIMISTQGEAVGQINGLAVYDMRAYRFGKVSRLTASTGVGAAGIINIEREAGLSGRTHDKGILILSGYLRRRYAREAPLTVSASVAFEQSYGMIDGDSASSAELYALLSDLAEMGIKQTLAVTGSVNQRGEIQAIGGVNEKVEAFYDLCADRGLTGDQGVLIPHQNVPDLQLRQDVVDAVAAGSFHLYAVETIDQGIELLTGETASRVHTRVAARLKEFHDRLRAPQVTVSGGGTQAKATEEGPPTPPPPSPPPPPGPPPPRDPGEPV